MKIQLYNDKLDTDLSPIEQVLYNRGIPKDKIKHYLNKTSDDLNSFEDLSNIKKAVDTLMFHIKKNNKILVQVDSDVDGYTSASMLINYLEANYPLININYQVHPTKTHGLELNEDILNGEYDLIIVPDAGSNEISKQKKLQQLGIDLIILDHHEVSELNKEAIIVNNQISDNYFNKNLSGAGIVWQFCRAIPHTVKSADEYVDLAAVGNIGDVMDMRNFETSYIVEQGIKLLSKGKGNKFLNALVEKQAYSLGESITPMGIAFYIAPLINAVVRVGTPEERLLIFQCFLDDECMRLIPSTKKGAKEGEMETILTQGTRLVGNIKNRQKRVIDKGIDELGGSINREYLINNSIVFINTNNAIPKDLNGLIANKLLSTYQRPSLVANIYEEEGQKYVVGSGRNSETNVLKDFKEFINQSGYAEYAEGHSNAFGFKMTLDNFNKFFEYANEHLNYDNVEKEYKIDYLFSDFYFPMSIIKELSCNEHIFAPFVEEPLIAVKNMRLSPSNVTFMRNNTVKIQKPFTCACIAFRLSEEEIEKLKKPCTVSFVGTPKLNVYNGEKTVQFLIQHLEIGA